MDKRDPTIDKAKKYTLCLVGKRQIKASQLRPRRCYLKKCRELRRWVDAFITRFTDSVDNTIRILFLTVLFYKIPFRQS